MQRMVLHTLACHKQKFEKNHSLKIFCSWNFCENRTNKISSHCTKYRKELKVLKSMKADKKETLNHELDT